MSCLQHFKLMLTTLSVHLNIRAQFSYVRPHTLLQRVHTCGDDSHVSAAWQACPIAFKLASDAASSWPSLNGSVYLAANGSLYFAADGSAAVATTALGDAGKGTVLCTVSTCAATGLA